MKLGIFGGTFNPVHLGHLINAGFVLETLKLDKILFIPAQSPVHKELTDEISSEERFSMLQLSIKGYNNFEASRLEIDRKEPSYTIYTLKQLKQIYSNFEFYFIIGLDSYLDFSSWKDPESILNIARIVVLKRTSHGDIKTEYNCDKRGFIFVENPVIELSSSVIRERIKNRLSIRYMVVPEVEKFIMEKEIYKK